MKGEEEIFKKKNIHT